MKTRTTSFRRLAASAGALSLALVGLAGTAAMADGVGDSGDPEPVLGNITGEAGTLIIHKHAGDPNGAGDGGDGTVQTGVPDPLEGVTFDVQRVGNTSVTGQDPLNLHTAEGWDLAATATASNVAAGAEWTLGTATTTGPTDVNGVTTVEDLAYGLYLVTEKSPGANNIVSPIAPFLVSIPFPSKGTWLYDVHVYPKNVIDEAPPTKTVEDPGAALVAGSTVTWTITKTIPAVAEGTGYSKLIVTDTLDDRLSISDDDVSVSLTDGTGALAEGDYSIDVTDQTVTVTLTESGRAKLAADATLTVTLNSKVVSTDDNAEIENTALVNVNGSEQETEPVAVYYGQIQVHKTAKENGVDLAGAKFELWAADEAGNKVGTEALDTLTTNSSGQFNEPFTVWVGTSSTAERNYVLVETQAPAGYITPTGADAETGFTVGVGEDLDVGYGVELVTHTITNTQHSGPNLPLTGSTGTLLFTLIGLGLVATGGTIAAVRHNRSKA